MHDDSHKRGGYEQEEMIPLLLPAGHLADDLKRSCLIYEAYSWNRCVDWIKLKNHEIMYLCTSV